MSKFNTTIDDNSPLLTYLPVDSWQYGSPATDSYANNYFGGGTFTVTNTTGATATFKFNGTGVWLYGAKRPNHGTYSVALDGQSASFSGKTSDGLRNLDAQGNEFQALLFSASNLASGSHEVVLTNEGAVPGDNFVDVDFIRWESSIGPDNSTMTSLMSTPSMNSSDFKMSGSGWGNAADNSELGASTGLYTNVAGDSVEITFEGDAVQIFGSIGVSCGIFDVEIDGGTSAAYNASRHQNITNQLLFSGANLGSGQHTVKMTNNQTSSGTLVIDHAEAYVAAAAVDPSASPSVNATSTGSSGGAHKALIGGLCGALGFIVIVLVALYLWVRQRRRVVIASKQTAASQLEAFDIDQAPPPPSHVSIHQTSLSDFLWGTANEKITHESHSAISKSSRNTDASTESGAHSQKTLALTASSKKTDKVDKADKGKHVYSPRHAHDDHSSRNASSSRLPYDISSRNTSSNRLPHDISGRNTSSSRLPYDISSKNASSSRLPNSKPHGGHHRSRQHLPYDSPTKKASRPLPIPPSGSSKDLNVNVVRVPPIPAVLHQPQRSTSMLKGRRRPARNSRILRAGYNFLFAKPGSSNSGSAYAPSTVLTSEISERPTTTLSPVTEAPPPLPSIRSQTPQLHRSLQIVNQVDEI